MKRTSLQITKRMVGNLYVGANVRQREQLGENYLGGTEVVAVHGFGSVGLVAAILRDHGANVKEFRYGVSCVEDISRTVKKADILLDGVHRGGEIEEAAASNPRLIVAECDCDDPFSAMSAVARIAMALFVRERTSHGQRLIASNCLDYWSDLNKYGRKPSF